MAKMNVESLIKKHTVDEVTNFAKVNEELQEQTVNIVAKEVAKETKKFDKDTVIKEFLMDNEFKSLDEFNAFKKNGATADTEAVKRLETELKTANESLAAKGNVEEQLNTYKNQSLLRSKGTLTADELEFYEYKINKLDGDTFEDKFNGFIESNPDVFTVESPPANKITTGVKLGTKPQVGDKLGWEKILEDKYGDLDK